MSGRVELVGSFKGLDELPASPIGEQKRILTILHSNRKISSSPGVTVDESINNGFSVLIQVET